ncbi:MAG TPA: hypothetical protein VE669_11835 [Actinomycetota bacterium]|nr:hypothetical protein [Actinomycetota bacterium]
MQDGARTARHSRPRRLLPLVLGAAVVVPLLLGFHWRSLGWRDRHYNYPARP